MYLFEKKLKGRTFVVRPFTMYCERLLFLLFEKIYLSSFHLSVDFGKFRNDWRDKCDYIFDGTFLFLVTFDAVEHRSIKRPEAKLDIVDFVLAENLAQMGQLGRKSGKQCAVMSSCGKNHELIVQVLQIIDQVMGVFQVTLSILPLFAQQIDQIHVPNQKFLLLVGLHSARLYQL